MHDLSSSVLKLKKKKTEYNWNNLKNLKNSIYTKYRLSFPYQKGLGQLCMMAHACNLSTQEAETS
jgi:hypothetical protein